MNHRAISRASQDEVTRLFTSVFTASEGEEEGRVVGGLASELALAINDQDVVCFGTYREELIIGSLFFTRLIFKDAIQVCMLAPVAVSTEHQGKGVGQALIKYGLDEMKSRSIAVAVTYGDPSFYSKVGFRELSEDALQAPLTLSMPEGWLGQSLSGEPVPVIKGRPTCVKAFRDPALW